MPRTSSPCFFQNHTRISWHTLYQLQVEHALNTHRNFSRSPSQFSFFPPNRLSLELPTSQCGWGSQYGILQTGVLKYVNLNCLVQPCKYTFVIPSSYAVGNFVQGRQFGWGLKSGNALAQTTLFSGFLLTILLTFLSYSLSFLCSTPTRYSSQVWRQCVWCRCRGKAIRVLSICDKY